MCLVCGSSKSEPHFGGISCRACAAFFRRYFHSKKSSKICNCEERTSNSHPCRKCRIEKCLRVGMDPDKVQSPRDSHSIEAAQHLPSTSLLAPRIVSRDTSNLEFAIPNWYEFQRKRRESTAGSMEHMNVYEVTCMTKSAIELTWNMVTNIFPATRDLKKSDKSALLRNFIPKLWQLGPIFNCIESRGRFNKMNESDYHRMVVSWYKGSFPKGKEMGDDEILKTFEPFWYYFITKIAVPIVGFQLEKEELMAIVWLLFFDNGYTNISQGCLEMCRNIKKVILRELKSFQIDREFDEMRLLDTVETLEIIERGEKKFMEEMLICEMHNVRIHEDFKAIIKENRI